MYFSNVKYFSFVIKFFLFINYLEIKKRNKKWKTTRETISKTKEDAENGNPEAILYLARETESASARKRKREENVVEVQVAKAKNKDDHARSREAKR